VYFQTKVLRSGFPNAVGICIFVSFVLYLFHFHFFHFHFAVADGGCGDVAGRMLMMRQSFSAVPRIMG